MSTMVKGTSTTDKLWEIISLHESLQKKQFLFPGSSYGRSFVEARYLPRGIKE